MAAILSIITATNNQEIGDCLLGHHFKFNLEEEICKTQISFQMSKLPSKMCWGTWEKSALLASNTQSSLKWQIISFSPKTYLSNSRKIKKA